MNILAWVVYQGEVAQTAWKIWPLCRARPSSRQLIDIRGSSAIRLIVITELCRCNYPSPRAHTDNNTFSSFILCSTYRDRPGSP
ncbi:hypothetical protein PM082_016738 [Marasmius tenuissimus]|nr:hypothetical protein PM082_016738 [Marasmius tenuissimus]